MGKLIAVEGIDGSGKNTQTDLLIARLTAEGKKVRKISFPCYSETFFGKEVARYLNGEFGGLDQVHPKLAAMLYAGDRYEKRDHINELIEDGFIVVADRYVPSNMAHQAVRVPEIERLQFSEWVGFLEYEIYKMPRPNLVIFLDMPPTKSQELILKKGEREYTDKSRDLHEENEVYLQDVHGYFCQLANSQNWTKVDCVKSQQLRAVEEIFSDVWQSISDVI